MGGELPTAVGRNPAPIKASGDVAEWLGSGLQSDPGDLLRVALLSESR
jgi:hypothetical protein